MTKLGRCNRSCNTLDDFPSRICASNKTEKVNLNVFNMTTIINESKTLIKDFICMFLSCHVRVSE